jgi:cytochrome c
MSACAMAQAPADRIRLGRSATPEELDKLTVFSVRPDGKGLPAGQGTAAQGRMVYASKCAACHGASGKEGGMFAGHPAAPLIDTRPWKAGEKIPATVGNFWPYATTIWEYTNRAMPYDRPGTLTHDEVYAVTAFLLQSHGLIAEQDIMNAQTLPRVRMPNAKAFISPDPRPDVR